ncbi:hypothetical protein, partial [Phascolarctobacterium faecium]|uniref:hypothetical protein n=1 Tax=Phascolarctobacterium faecium TaxID=33025 RepID=UPI003A93A217
FYFFEHIAMPFVIITPMYPPQDARSAFCTFLFFAAIRLAPPILCKRLDVLVSKVGQAMEKFF